MNIQQRFGTALFEAHELGVKTGQLRERRIIIDYLADHIPAAPGGAQWVDNVVAFIASRTEQEPDEPNGEKCGYWFTDDEGERRQCWQPNGHDGGHLDIDGHSDPWGRYRQASPLVAYQEEGR